MSSLTHNQKRILFAILIPIITLGVFGIPFSNIGFDSDCFGLVSLSASIHSWNDLVRSLTAPIQHVYLPPNELASYQEGYLSYFRPLMVLSHYLVYQLVGINPYAYHLINVSLHGLTASGIFYLYAQCVPLTISFLLALTFAFHPALTPTYVGVTSHVVPTYLFLVLSTICYYHACRRKNWKWHLGAALFLLGSLLCYEIAIVFPIVALLYHLFSGENLKYVWSQTLILWLTIFGYLAGRLALLGVNSSGKGSGISFAALIMKIIGNWHQAIKPFWGMKLHGKFLPAFATLLFILGILYSFYHNKEQRWLICWYVLSFFICSWPISLITSDGRYFYPAIPFFCLMLYEMLTSIRFRLPHSLRSFAMTFLIKSWQKKITPPIAKSNPKMLIPLIIIILWFAVTSYSALATREHILHARDNAFQSLVDQHLDSKNTRFIFLGTMHYFAGDTLIMQQGMTQAAKIFFNNHNLDAYHITEAKLYSPTKKPGPYTIEKILDNSKVGLRLSFPEPEKLCLMVPHSWQENNTIPYSMGTLIIHHKTASWKANDISFFVDEKWLTNDTCILSFNYSSQQFKKVIIS